MEGISLFHLFKEKTIDASFEFFGPLQERLAELIKMSFSKSQNNGFGVGPIEFIPSKDKRIRQLTYEQYYPGRTVSDAIVKIENEFPVRVTAIPREDGGYTLSLEYYEREFINVK